MKSIISVARSANKEIEELSADQIALLTATPINRQFSDVIKLLEHFFGPWATSADLKRLRNLGKR